MPFLGYEQITVAAIPLDRSDLTIPTRTDRVVVQAESQDVRYMMVPEGEGARTPTQSLGMVFVAGLAPEEFLFEDFRHITFVRGAGSDGILNIHYYTGRNIP